MKLETKTVAAKVTEAKADGTATALVSVFGNVDLGGDRVLPGAFTRSLEEWQAKGDPIPVIWSHDWDNPESFVGWADPAEIRETDAGLEVPMKFDLDRPRAEQVHHLLKTRRVTQFSFGYFVRAYQDVEDADYGTVRELADVDLFEVGPTLLGMNPETELLQAASALRGLREGRTLDAKSETTIREAYEALGAVLESLPESDEPKATEPEAKAVEVPSYVSENAARGLAYLDEGYGGDGLVEQTIRDARDMVSGEIRDEKVRLMGPWIARHIVDLDAPANSNPDDDGYPGPGLVAMLLWGAGPDVEGARRTQEWAEAQAARLDEESASTVESIEEKNTEDSPADAGDTQGTIPSEHILALLTRPRNTEE